MLASFVPARVALVLPLLAPPPRLAAAPSLATLSVLGGRLLVFA